MTLIYAVALLILFYLLLVGEFCLPTGGFLGICAVAVLAAAIGVAFSHSLAAGTSVIFFVLITTPLVVFGMLKAWPHTPIGRRMLNRRPGQTANEPPLKTTTGGTPLADLVGRSGVAKTDLLPSGQVVVDGEKVDAVSLGMPIDRGTPIVIHSVDTGHVRVRAASEEELGADTTSTPVPKSPQSLEESLESFDVE